MDPNTSTPPSAKEQEIEQGYEQEYYNALDIIIFGDIRSNPKAPNDLWVKGNSVELLRSLSHLLIAHAKKKYPSFFKLFELPMIQQRRHPHGSRANPFSLYKPDTDIIDEAYDNGTGFTVKVSEIKEASYEGPFIYTAHLARAYSNGESTPTEMGELTTDEKALIDRYKIYVNNRNEENKKKLAEEKSQVGQKIENVNNHIKMLENYIHSPWLRIKIFFGSKIALAKQNAVKKYIDELKQSRQDLFVYTYPLTLTEFKARIERISPSKIVSDLENINDTVLKTTPTVMRALKHPELQHLTTSQKRKNDGNLGKLIQELRLHR